MLSDLGPLKKLTFHTNLHLRTNTKDKSEMIVAMYTVSHHLIYLFHVLDGTMLIFYGLID